VLKIAVYGKGGIGKSTFSSNLSAAFGRLGKKTIQVGCDPKHDSTFTLTGTLIPTVVEVLSSYKFKSDEIEREEIVFPGKFGVDCVEAGGPPAGAGCGGYVVGETVKLLEKFGIYQDYEVMVFDVLGDVVCGGFSAPLQHSEQVIIVATNDFDSIFAANRIATAIGIKQKSGGGQLAGIVANRAGDAELVGPFADRIGTVCLTCIPDNDAVRRSRLTAQTVFDYEPEGTLGAPWMELAQRMLDGVPLTVPTPIPERELFAILGADYVRTPEAALAVAGAR
jgi:light-independent protochlorophyllide reductase subunit L